MNLFVFAFRFDTLKTETISYIEMAKCPSAHPSASGPHSLGKRRFFLLRNQKSTILYQGLEGWGSFAIDALANDRSSPQCVHPKQCVRHLVSETPFHCVQ